MVSSRWLIVVVTALAVVLGFSLPAYADPDEGDGGTLREQLTNAAIAYNEAKVKLDNSTKKQAELQATMKVTDVAEANDFVRPNFRGGWALPGVTSGV